MYGPDWASGSHLLVASMVGGVPYVRCFLRLRIGLKALSMPVSLWYGVYLVCVPSAVRGLSCLQPLLGRDRGFPGRNIRPSLFWVSYVEQTAPSGYCRGVHWRLPPVTSLVPLMWTSYAIEEIL